jgi:hypothetical protein
MKKTLMACISAAFVALAPVAQAADDAATGGCSPDIQKAQDEARAAYITARTALANQNYSTAPESFSNLSCLDRLMNSGMDIFFQPPSMSDLLGLVENFVCDKSNEIYQDATAPLNQTFQGGLQGTGEIIPGVNLGSMTGGINIRPTTGGNGGIVRSNADDILGTTGMVNNADDSRPTLQEIFH